MEMEILKDEQPHGDGDGDGDVDLEIAKDLLLYEGVRAVARGVTRRDVEEAKNNLYEGVMAVVRVLYRSYLGVPLAELRLLFRISPMVAHEVQDAKDLLYIGVMSVVKVFFRELEDPRDREVVEAKDHLHEGLMAVRLFRPIIFAYRSIIFCERIRLQEARELEEAKVLLYRGVMTVLRVLFHIVSREALSVEEAKDLLYERVMSVARFVGVSILGGQSVSVVRNRKKITLFF